MIKTTSGVRSRLNLFLAASIVTTKAAHLSGFQWQPCIMETHQFIPCSVTPQKPNKPFQPFTLKGTNWKTLIRTLNLPHAAGAQVDESFMLRIHPICMNGGAPAPSLCYLHFSTSLILFKHHKLYTTPERVVNGVGGSSARQKVGICVSSSTTCNRRVRTIKNHVTTRWK